LDSRELSIHQRLHRCRYRDIAGCAVDEHETGNLGAIHFGEREYVETAERMTDEQVGRGKVRETQEIV